MQGRQERKGIKLQLLDDRIFTINNFLLPHECDEWIRRAENPKRGKTSGFKPSPVSGGGHGRTGREVPRTSQFRVFPDEVANADVFWNRVRDFLPTNLTHLNRTGYLVTDHEKGGTEADSEFSWRPVGVNPRFRVYKYEKGQAFPEHVDYKMRRTIWRNGGQKFYQQTFMTILIYLNRDERLVGGDTGFWTHHDDPGVKEHCRFLSGSVDKPHNILVSPEVGKALISDQNILHEGMEVVKGLKYVLRTDVVHEKRVALHPKVIKMMTEAELRDREEEWEIQFEPSCKNYAD